jgi:hypothetical protein
MLGLPPGAWVIILQALATYAGIGSAVFFARPILNTQALMSSRDVVSSMSSDKPDVAAMLNLLKDKLNGLVLRKQPGAKQDNLRGLVLLVVSFLLFTGAVVLQVATDSAFG